jgi:hypothetical protein
MDQSGPARKQSLPLPMPRGRRPASASRGPDQGRVSIMKIDGGCHCGYITYEAEVDPEKTTICHCTDCQHLSGSAFRTVVRVAGDTFKIIAGEPTIYVKTAESGARRVQGFCPRCGTPIYSTAEGDDPKLYSIRVSYAGEWVTRSVRRRGEPAFL